MNNNDIQTTITLAFIVAMLMISIHFVTKIIDWIQRHKFLRYQNSSSEFISDLYKLKMKWAKRGEFMYCKAIDTVIGAEMMSDKEPMPETAEGRNYIEKIKQALAEEAAKNSDSL